MLKGLKKVKVDDSKKEVIEFSSKKDEKKKWKRTQSKTQKEEEEEIHEEGFKDEKRLGKLCEDLWTQFTTGEVLKATKTCEKLFIEQDQHFEKVFRGERRKQDDNQDLSIDLFSKSEKEEQQFYEGTKFDSTQYREGLKEEKRQKQTNHNYEDIAADFFKKYKTAYDNDEIVEQEYNDKQFKTIGDKDEEANKKKTKKEEKIDAKKVQKQERFQFFAEKKLDNSLQSCNFCLSNKRLLSEQIISLGTSTALILPINCKNKLSLLFLLQLNSYLKQKERYQKIFHLQIIPIEHICSLVEAEEEVYEEIRNFQKCLVQAFDQKDYEVLFFENAVNMNSVPHLVVECVTLPRNTAAEIPVYFKQGIENMESEWNTHKKLYKITREQGGIRSQIPKGFAYFYADFGLRFGYAHIVEEEKAFSKNFAHEIICEIMNLEKPKVLYPPKASKEQLQHLKDTFEPIWKEYNWTKCI